MFSVISGQVIKIIKDFPELQEILVEVKGLEQPQRAYNYPQLYRKLALGDLVKMNSAAVSLGLGTGGRHFVLPEYPSKKTCHYQGHIMKLRYTPWQTPVLAAEEEKSPYHESLVSKCDLGGMPVVAATLHSMLPGIILGFRETVKKIPKIAYVMTDGAALPIALSDLIRQLRSKQLLDLTVTAGNAYGGDLEAVSIPSALMVAKEAIQADLIIVSLGPGIVGTGTKLGFSGIEQAWVIDMTARLGGIPIAVPRISEADIRERHQGLSHHTLTVLNMTSNPSLMAISRRLSTSSRDKVITTLAQNDLLRKNECYLVDDPQVEQLFDQHQLKVRSMGHGVAEDPDFFQTTVAAGYLAGLAATGSLSKFKTIGEDHD